MCFFWLVFKSICVVHVIDVGYVCKWLSARLRNSKKRIAIYVLLSSANICVHHEPSAASARECKKKQFVFVFDEHLHTHTNTNANGFVCVSNRHEIQLIFAPLMLCCVYAFVALDQLLQSVVQLRQLFTDS